MNAFIPHDFADECPQTTNPLKWEGLGLFPFFLHILLIVTALAFPYGRFRLLNRDPGLKGNFIFMSF